VTITQLPVWDATAIEIALDLMPLRHAQASGLNFSGPGEPRVCLLAGFALSSQLPRIVAAVDRAVPAQLPSPLRIAQAPSRYLGRPAAGVSIQPVLPLLRLQSRLTRSIEPGLTHDNVRISVGGNRDMDETTVRFIRDFIALKTPPSFEPLDAAALADMLRLRVAGITIYQLGRRGAPQSIVEHWSYKRETGSSVHLVRGP
jgi:hypothetical protein